MTAIQIRDEAWVNSTLIPSWVRGREVSLDQHNTPTDVAKYCWDSFKRILDRDGKILSNYKIVEPSAGGGSFYELLPEKNRIGIDIEIFDTHPSYVHADFLTWNPLEKDQKYISIGNPPFGYRGRTFFH